MIRVTGRLMALTAVLLCVSVSEGLAQRWRGGSDYTQYNVDYDGKLTFVRLSFTPAGGGWGRRGRGQLYWDHDWPIAETNLMKLIEELTSIAPQMDGSNILAGDDPDLAMYPVVYVSEPGHWTLSQAEIEGLRNYLLKGGFMILDDFADRYDWVNFEEKMLQILPGARLVQLDASHDVFHSFFDIDDLEFMHPNYYGFRAEFWGIFEENDPNKRLMIIANFNNDIGDYMEYSETGWLPVELTNEAYKLAINYIVYAMTH